MVAETAKDNANDERVKEGASTGSERSRARCAEATQSETGAQARAKQERKEQRDFSAARSQT